MSDQRPGVPDEMQRQIDEFHIAFEHALQRGDANERLQAELATTASATSMDGGVTVAVSSAGLLEDVRLSQRTLALGARGLSRVLMSTLREALENLQHEVEAAAVRADAGAVGSATVTEVRAALAGPINALTPDEDRPERSDR